MLEAVALAAALTQFNPKPLPDDLVLPMPCGAEMVFRRVETPAAPGLLEDRRVVLGGEDAETNHAEYPRIDFIAGALGDGTAGRRWYYIGKYEVTREQYAAVAEAGCRAAPAEAALPAAGIGWFDAVAFAQRYSVWLLGNARARLPAAGEAPAFVRLPTEAEWEFAARGGAAVAESVFRQRLPAPADPPARHAWHQGAESARGRAHAVGRLEPNALGLHDMLGNLAEIVLEPYRLNRGGRLHGQAGGFVAKGGDYLTPAGRLRAAMRIEYPHFDAGTGAPIELPTLGFRVALAAPVTTGLDQAGDLREAWAREAQQRRQLPDDPAALLRDFAEATADAGQRAAIEKVQQALVAERSGRLAAEERAAHSAIGSGAVLIRALRDYDHRVAASAALLGSLKANRDPDRARHAERVKRLGEQLGIVRDNRALTLRVLSDLLLQTADDVTRERLEGALARWQEENADPDRRALRDFAQRFVDLVDRYRARPVPDGPALLAELAR